LVSKTKYVCDLIRLEQVEASLYRLLASVEQGIWAVDDKGQLQDLQIRSALGFEHKKSKLLQCGRTLFVAGGLSNKLIDFLQMQPAVDGITVIVSDFTKIFVQPNLLQLFFGKGGQLKVLHKTRLIALTVNPTSPQGYVMDAQQLQKRLKEALCLPVYDVRELLQRH
jgi:hypothetical protein